MAPARGLRPMPPRGSVGPPQIHKMTCFAIRRSIQMVKLSYKVGRRVLKIVCRNFSMDLRLIC